MTEHTLTVDSVEQIPINDEGDLQWAAWGTADDGTGLMGYGDTKAAAIADLNASLIAAFAGDPAVDPPETNPDAVPVDQMPPDPPPDFSFNLSLGSGLLTGNHDLLA